METVTEYIDYSENAELWEAATHMSNLEQVIFAGIRDDAIKELGQPGRADSKGANPPQDAKAFRYYRKKINSLL
ncbi:MAG: hypothetical protein HFG83_09270 [Dorea sp.]|jgi:hypothetical protein|nr:hypothetical protein [Dorea sp.]MCI9454001.1 hypothetical protein [Dorea sp.]